jgi:hypothetical protein
MVNERLPSYLISGDILPYLEISQYTLTLVNISLLWLEMLSYCASCRLGVTEDLFGTASSSSFSGRIRRAVTNAVESGEVILV